MHMASGVKWRAVFVMASCTTIFLSPMFVAAWGRASGVWRLPLIEIFLMPMWFWSAVLCAVVAVALAVWAIVHITIRLVVGVLCFFSDWYKMFDR